MFWDNLCYACEMRGTKVTPLLNELNISSGNIGKWSRGGDISSKNLIKLANRLDVSVDFLLFGRDPVVSGSLFCANETEETLIRQFRVLTPYQKEKCMTYVQGLYDSSEHVEERKLSG